MLSVDQHIVRNLVTLHALEQGLPVPIGTQDAAMLDTAVSDADEDYTATDDTAGEAGEDGPLEDIEARPQGTALAAYQNRAAAIYQRYQRHLPGAIAFLRFPDGSDALVRVNDRGELVSQSLSGIFRAAACAPETPALPRAASHHDLVNRCVQIATDEQTSFGGQLGSLRSVRRKLWERLTRYRRWQKANPLLFSSQTLEQLDSVLDLIWRFPLKRSAQDAISRQMRLGITDEALVTLVLRRAADDNLCDVRDDDQEERGEPRLICCLGLVHPLSSPTSTEGQP